MSKPITSCFSCSVELLPRALVVEEAYQFAHFQALERDPNPSVSDQCFQSDAELFNPQNCPISQRLNLVERYVHWEQHRLINLSQDLMPVPTLSAQKYETALRCTGYTHYYAMVMRILRDHLPLVPDSQR